MSKIRTRIAPSPTGDPHLGTAYTALFNRCFAHSQKGKFILRIEDTDQARSTAKSEQDILQALAWLGLDWDEGPDCGGSFGPYRQSERGEIYREHSKQLLEKGGAFPCFCTAERLAELRTQQVKDKQQPGYDGHCLALDEKEAAKRITAGEAHVIRLKVPTEGESSFNDVLRGEVAINWAQIDMQVLMKSDGHPTYHFANVVDDHLMEISHVIRGEEWLNSIPKHLLLYQAFGWEPPVFCHMPLLRNPDQSKLSKRKNPTSINYYRDMGYLPQALVNYLGLMGWSLPSGEEKFTVDEMSKQFDISRISLGGPIFDVKKLDWLNGKYLREDMNTEQFIAAYTAWAFEPEKIKHIAELVQQRAERFTDIAPIGGHFLAGQVPVTADTFKPLKMDATEIKQLIQFALWRLEALPDFEPDTIKTCLQGLAEQMNLKIRDFLAPLFIAITGQQVSTSVIGSISILGLDISRARLRHAIEQLGGISKKQMKALEQDYKKIAGN
ncbi:MAG: glutamate--tRNA ligase [Pseudohongiellaceae bacterium]